MDEELHLQFENEILAIVVRMILNNPCRSSSGAQNPSFESSSSEAPGQILTTSDTTTPFYSIGRWKTSSRRSYR